MEVNSLVSGNIILKIAFTFLSLGKASGWLTSIKFPQYFRAHATVNAGFI